MKISAFFIADQINLRTFREAYAGQLLQENPSELFYLVEDEQYLYVFDYGVVVFANMPAVDVSKNLLLLKEFSLNPLNEQIVDDFVIEHRPDGGLKFHFDSLVVPRLDQDVLKIAMFNVAQSVAMDHFTQRAQALLAELRRFASEMEAEGSVNISRKNMIKFIGRALNSKNKIIENLFVFDSPEMTWEDEYLDKVHRGLSRTLELQSRFREIEYTFKITEDNLSVFRELYMHRESSQLEWIIIALILIEVFDLIISKFW
jgi:required for meiotic nuclear division protein 1